MFRTWRLASLLLIVLVLVGACARSPEARKTRHLDRGDRYFMQEKYREAILEYRNALRIDSTDAKATRQLGLAHYALGELGQALQYLQRAEKLDPSHTEVHVKLGQIYLLAGRTEEARAEAEAVLERLPTNLDALILVAGAARTPGEVTIVTHRLEAARSGLGHVAKFHVALAGLYLRAGDVGPAERALLEAVAKEPGSVDAHTALGNFYASRRDATKAEREYQAAADLARPGSPARIRLADFYLSRGPREKARRVLEEVARAAPDYLPAWRQLTGISFAEARIDDSVEALQRVLSKSPGDTEGRILRGRIHLAEGETTEVITEFQRLLRHEPRLAPAHYHLAVAHLRAGNLQQARSALREAINNAPSFAEAIQLPALLNIQTGVVGTAIDDLEALLKSQPGAMGAYPLLSAAYLKQRDHARAFTTARKLASVVPQDARGPYLAGAALLAQGRRADARRELDGALTLAPGFLDPLVQLANLDMAENQPRAAIERVQQQITLAPVSGAHQSLLGNLYLLRGEPRLAEVALLKAIDLSPHLLDPYIRLATLYAETRRYEEALAKLGEAAKVNPRNPAPLTMAGIVHEQKGDVARAREAYEKALALNPRLAPAANNLAWLYSEHGGDTAKELSPDDPRISDTLGWILHRRGAHERALALLTESAGKLPDNPQVQYHLGVVYAKLGDNENARKALDLAVSAGQSFHGKDEARRVLADLK